MAVQLFGPCECHPAVALCDGVWWSPPITDLPNLIPPDRWRREERLADGTWRSERVAIPPPAEVAEAFRNFQGGQK